MLPAIVLMARPNIPWHHKIEVFLVQSVKSREKTHSSGLRGYYRVFRCLKMVGYLINQWILHFFLGVSPHPIRELRGFLMLVVPPATQVFGFSSSSTGWRWAQFKKTRAAIAEAVLGRLPNHIIHVSSMKEIRALTLQTWLDVVKKC